MYQSICIYHGNCIDGWAAAWAIKHFFPSMELFEGIYGKNPPDVTDKNVIIADFSYDYQTICHMADDAVRITILDHHISAYRDLSKQLLPNNVYYRYRNDRSGAVLAWEFAETVEPAPKLLQHIQDRDLWKFELDGSREIHEALKYYEKDFQVWEKLVYSFEKNQLDLILDGKLLLRKHNQDLDDIIKSNKRLMRIGSFLVPVVNAPYQYASDIGDKLSFGAPFAATYFDTENHRQFSLRSKKDSGLDVSEIAKKYGGGGHAQAAGFKVDRDHSLARE